MSATNSTTNYALPIFIGTDKPAWLVDWNGAMTAIDAAIKEIDTKVQGAIVDISGLSSTVASHTSSISTISGQITVITTNLNTATGNINTINSLIGNGTPTTTDQTLIGAINELHANQGDLADLTTPATSLVAAINAISAGGAVAANAVSYNNASSGLTADDVQAAIDELKDDIDNIVIPSGATVLAEVTADGVKTVAQLLADLWSLIPSDTPYDTMAKTVMIAHTGATKKFAGYIAGQNAQYNSFYIDPNNNVFHAEHQSLKSANTYYAQCTGNTSGFSFDNSETTAVPTSGKKMQILVIN